MSGLSECSIGKRPTVNSLECLLKVRKGYRKILLWALKRDRVSTLRFLPLHFVKFVAVEFMVVEVVLREEICWCGPCISSAIVG